MRAQERRCDQKKKKGIKYKDDQEKRRSRKNVIERKSAQIK